MNAPSSKLRMPDLRLLTPRLELVAGTMQLAQAEVSNLPSFAQLLDAPTPASWPPPLNDEHSKQYFLASLQKAEASDTGWNLWFCVRREPRELIGNARFADGWVG
jgi:[ribosomal protein S5]-alanine N-acetyltransferase